MKTGEEIGYSGLQNLLANSDFDYIAVALTPWHAFGVVGAVKEMERKVNRNLNGIVLISKNPKEEYLINSDYFDLLNASCFFFYGNRNGIQMVGMELDTAIYSLLKCGYTNRPDFYIFAHNRPPIYLMSFVDKALKVKRRIVSVLCDEGIGSYTDTGKERILQFKHAGASVLKLWKHYFEEYLLVPRATEQLKSSDRATDLCLFYKDEHGDLIMREGVVNGTASAIGHYANSNCLSLPTISDEYVLINTQAFLGGEIDDVSKVDELWKELIRYLLEQKIDVWIKPHPREVDVEKYKLMGAHLIECKGVAQEVLLMKIKKPMVVISLYSTTLISAPIINGVPSISITRIIDKMECSTDIYRTYSERFYTLFKRYSCFIESINEFKECIARRKFKCFIAKNV